ncbi:grasp-with-spasm system SPASM domain peptide maturase [Haliscomenobacter sp.]|uniref:grasp-with-spasm system SPASM domain peptide maturase n=1 Tax=Haliscomenobacter sp. TaxID=2717303 RepID=UPI0035944819
MKYAEQATQYLKLFSNCFVTKGVIRSIIVDGYRGGFEFIPNDLGDLLQEAEQYTIGELYTQYGEENYPAIDEYIDYLLEKELVFMVSAAEKSCFPALSMEWRFPGKIANAILDVGAAQSYDLPAVLQQLDELQCLALQVRLFAPQSLEWLENLLKACSSLTFESINLFLPYDSLLDEERLLYLALAHQKIASIVVHGAPETRRIRHEAIDKLAGLFYIETPIVDESHCGVTLPEYFSANLLHYTESLAANTCLNHKIAVDRFGNIKNCPSMIESYGHANEVSLKAALAAEGFKTKWSIKKEQIDVCQVCEFRHICTDCRGYLAEPANVYSKPAKCSYDPYVGVWN